MRLQDRILKCTSLNDSNSPILLLYASSPVDEFRQCLTFYRQRRSRFSDDQESPRMRRGISKESDIVVFCVEFDWTEWRPREPEDG